MKDTDNSANFIQVIDPDADNSGAKPRELVKSYDKDGVHYEEYSDGSTLKYTSTLPVQKDWTDGEGWKTKKDYVKSMNWLNKILYYLWIIVLYKTLPVKCAGHLVNDKPFLQTCQGNTYSTYWHWNWWNPLTYIVIACFLCFMFLMNIIITIIQTLKMTNKIKIDIND